MTSLFHVIQSWWISWECSNSELFPLTWSSFLFSPLCVWVFCIHFTHGWFRHPLGINSSSSQVRVHSDVAREERVSNRGRPPPKKTSKKSVSCLPCRPAGLHQNYPLIISTHAHTNTQVLFTTRTHAHTHRWIALRDKWTSRVFFLLFRAAR